jgi:hypothetical protein
MVVPIVSSPALAVSWSGLFIAAGVMTAMRTEVAITWLPVVLVGMDGNSEAARQCLE